jgi:16S rRNA (cytidine1402-2'-O)-methyltransferase
MGRGGTVTLYLVELPLGGENELTLRARRLLDEAVLILAGCPARDRLESACVPRGVPLLSPEDVGPAGVVAAVRAAAVGGHVAWAVPGLAQWSEVDHATLSGVLAAGVEVLPVPGGPFWVGCLAASGLPSDRFTFLGRMPVTTGVRRAQLQRLVAERHTLIWWVPAAALPAVLRDAGDLMGDRTAAECSANGIWRGKLRDAPSGALDVYLVVEGAGEEPAWTEKAVREWVRQRLAEGASTRDAARTVADAARWPRRRVYEIALEVGAERGG